MNWWQVAEVVSAGFTLAATIFAANAARDSGDAAKRSNDLASRSLDAMRKANEIAECAVRLTTEANAINERSLEVLKASHEVSARALEAEHAQQRARTRGAASRTAILLRDELKSMASLAADFRQLGDRANLYDGTQSELQRVRDTLKAELDRPESASLGPELTTQLASVLSVTDTAWINYSQGAFGRNPEERLEIAIRMLGASAAPLRDLVLQLQEVAGLSATTIPTWDEATKPPL